MFVLVTGVTGRIGRNLARALNARGDRVRGLVLPDDPGLDRAAAAGVDCLIGNLRDPAAATAAVAGVEAVVHLGAMMLWGGDEHNPTLFEDNLRGTFNLAQAAATTGGLSRFVFASSDEVYPSLFARYLPIDENHPRQPYSFYGLTKLAGEEMLHYFHRAHRLPIAIARFALTFEPWESVRPEGALGRFLFLQPMVGMIRNRAGEDAAAAVARLSDDERTLLLARDEADGRTCSTAATCATSFRGCYCSSTGQPPSARHSISAVPPRSATTR